MEKSMIEGIATALGVKSGSLLAAFFGSLVSLPFIKAPEYTAPWKTAAYKAGILFAGIFAAIHVGPLVADGSDYQHMAKAIIFLTGVFFMSIATAIMKVIHQTDLRTLSDVLKAWTGKSK